MLEESMPAIFASVYGCFTPAVLFLLLNLVIATIAVTSRTSSGGGDRSDGTARLYRSPSIVLDRLRSLKLHRYRFDDVTPPIVSVPAPTSQILDAILASHPSAAVAPVVPAEEHHEEDHGYHLGRSQSDAHPTAGELPAKLPARMKKSAGERSPFDHFEEAEILETRPPAKAKPTEATACGWDEVDARADDFINQFRHQLKLQRLASIMRYKEMLQTGAAGN